MPAKRASKAKREKWKEYEDYRRSLRSEEESSDSQRAELHFVDKQGDPIWRKARPRRGNKGLPCRYRTGKVRSQKSSARIAREQKKLDEKWQLRRTAQAALLESTTAAVQDSESRKPTERSQPERKRSCSVLREEGRSVIRLLPRKEKSASPVPKEEVGQESSDQEGSFESGESEEQDSVDWGDIFESQEREQQLELEAQQREELERENQHRDRIKKEAEKKARKALRVRFAAESAALASTAAASAPAETGGGEESAPAGESGGKVLKRETDPQEHQSQVKSEPEPVALPETAATESAPSEGGQSALLATTAESGSVPTESVPTEGTSSGSALQETTAESGSVPTASSEEPGREVQV